MNDDFKNVKKVEVKKEFIDPKRIYNIWAREAREKAAKLISAGGYIVGWKKIKEFTGLDYSRLKAYWRQWGLPIFILEMGKRRTAVMHIADLETWRKLMLLKSHKLEFADSERDKELGLREIIKLVFDEVMKEVKNQVKKMFEEREEKIRELIRYEAYKNTLRVERALKKELEKINKGVQK